MVYRASLLRKWGLRPRRFESSRLRIKHYVLMRLALGRLCFTGWGGFEKLLRQLQPKGEYAKRYTSHAMTEVPLTLPFIFLLKMVQKAE